jgi:hypothetical protein
VDVRRVVQALAKLVITDKEGAVQGVLKAETFVQYKPMSSRKRKGTGNVQPCMAQENQNKRSSLRL